MSFKNALKNLVAHFGIVWAILLYVVICMAIIVGLSLPFLLPIIDAFDAAGVFQRISDAFSALFEADGWNGLWNGLYAAYASITEVFQSNTRVASLTMAFLILVPIIALRFLFGLCDVPIATVLDGRMSCNADYGLGGKFFSTLWVSARFSLAKLPVTVITDSAMFATMYGLGKAIGMSFALPFVIIAVLLIFRTFRSSLLACWAPSVVGGSGILRGFIISARVCFKRFGSMYSTYFMTLLLYFAFLMFVTLFTLGVGLVIAIPIGYAWISYLDMTEFYNKTGKRYYIDGVVFTPPSENLVSAD